MDQYDNISNSQRKESGKSKRTIKAIQFYSDRVIADYGDGKVYQACMKCHNGKHLRAFLNHFRPDFDLNIMNEEETIAMEHRLFNILKHGAARRIVNREIHDFATYLEKRFK